MNNSFYYIFVILALLSFRIINLSVIQNLYRIPRLWNMTNNVNSLNLDAMADNNFYKDENETLLEETLSYVLKEIMASKYRSMFIQEDDGKVEKFPLVDLFKYQKSILYIVTSQLRSINFHVFSKNNSKTPYIIRLDYSNSTHLDKIDKKSLSVKIIIHEWQNSGNSLACLDIKDAYLESYNYSVIILDWGDMAKNTLYSLVLVHLKHVANILQGFIEDLIKYGIDIKKIHIIGQGVGAHIAGFSQNNLRNKVGRITGLDPARAGFERGILENLGGEGKLSIRNSDFVDVIHTSVGSSGIEYSLGHIDFYADGGKTQYECENISDYYACNPGTAVKIFIKSIRSTIYGHNCLNKTKRKIPMGDKTPRDARGLYCSDINFNSRATEVEHESKSSKDLLQLDLTTLLIYFTIKF